MRKIPEEELEMIADLPPVEQTLIYQKIYRCDDADMMDLLEVTGAFLAEKR